MSFVGLLCCGFCRHLELQYQGFNNSTCFWLKIQGSQWSGKSQWKKYFFKVSEKSVNFVKSQWKTRFVEKSVKSRWIWKKTSVRDKNSAENQYIYLLYPLLQQSWKGGILVSPCPSVRLSVCGQNRVRSVSSTILNESISYLHILSSNLRRCVVCNVCLKNLKLWQIL